MKTKYFISIAAAMLFTLASFAQGGERVYIREYTAGSLKVKVYIWQNGVTKEQILNTGVFGREAKENLNEFATLLESYLKQGFKIVSVITKPTGSADTITEYILQKD